MGISQVIFGVFILTAGLYMNHDYWLNAHNYDFDLSDSKYSIQQESLEDYNISIEDSDKLATDIIYNQITESTSLHLFTDTSYDTEKHIIDVLYDSWYLFHSARFSKYQMKLCFLSVNVLSVIEF